ncbi:MAG TPA: hypothetical protein VG602_02295 [Actinomycetota bacterium]|nr:hypothetical protein [Actinomycetota bacterium]
MRGREGARAGALLVLASLVAGLVLSPPVVAEPATATKSFVRKLVNRRVANLAARIRGTQLSTFSTSQPGPVPITGTNTDVPVATLSVPPGSYALFAKLWWRPIQASSTQAGGEIECELVADGIVDTSRGAGVGDFDYGTLTLIGSSESSADRTVTLRCRDEFSAGNPVEVHNLNLTAITVGNVVTRVASVARSGSAAEPPPRPGRATR